MENILNLKTYNKYLNLIKEGLLLVPDNNLSNLIDDVEAAYIDKPNMIQGETHEVTLKAGKKVRITSRGSLRNIEIDGVTYDSTEQAACSIYDPYDEYLDLTEIIRDDATNFTFIPIIDPHTDTIRYTISKYSKGLKKYFDPHKVVKAVYSLNHILFYVKDKKDILRKYYFRITSINMNDVIPLVCEKFARKYGPEKVFYLAFFIHEEYLPFTVGACKDDFYALKDILNKISFKGTTPLKYMLFQELSDSRELRLLEKEELTYDIVMSLLNKDRRKLCEDLNIEMSTYDEMMKKSLYEVTSLKGKRVTRKHILKYLHITENVNELKYYEKMNLIWKVKYNDIPS